MTSVVSLSVCETVARAALQSIAKQEHIVNSTHFQSFNTSLEGERLGQTGNSVRPPANTHTHTRKATIYCV